MYTFCLNKLATDLITHSIITIFAGLELLSAGLQKF